MKTVYELRGYMTRQNITGGVLLVVTFYGFFEIWNGINHGDQAALIFGVLFIGGAIWGGRTLFEDSRDQVGRFENDENGGTVATLWRPFQPLKLTSADALTGWRHYVKIAGRAGKRHFLFADHPAHPRPLQFEFRPDVEITDELRDIAGEAIAEYEAATAPRSEAD